MKKYTLITLIALFVTTSFTQACIGWNIKSVEKQYGKALKVKPFNYKGKACEIHTHKIWKDAEAVMMVVIDKKTRKVTDVMDTAKDGVNFTSRMITTITNRLFPQTGTYKTDIQDTYYVKTNSGKKIVARVFLSREDNGILISAPFEDELN